MFKRIIPMALASALCLGLAIYTTAPKGEGTSTYTASAEGFGSGVTVTMTFAGGKVTDVQVDASGETEAIGGAAAEELAAQVLSANGGEIDGVSGATLTSNAVKEAVAEIMAQAGNGSATYTASAQGFGSDVTVTMTFKGDTVTEVVVDASGETESIGGAAAEELAANVKAANGGEFDGVSGATLTSNAVKAAVADIMSQKG